MRRSIVELGMVTGRRRRRRHRRGGRGPAPRRRRAGRRRCTAWSPRPCSPPPTLGPGRGRPAGDDRRREASRRAPGAQGRSPPPRTRSPSSTPTPPTARRRGSTRSPTPAPASSRSRRARAAWASRRSPRTSRSPWPQRGHRVAAVDADVWGFSMPRMLGIRTPPGLDRRRDRPARVVRRAPDLDGLLRERRPGGHLARPDAAQGARAVPHRRPLGRPRLPR